MWGHSPISKKEGSRYYISFIDDYIDYCWVHLTKYHYNFLNIYNAFQVYVKTQHSIVIKCFTCDLGGEYTFNAFCELLASHGTIHHTSCIDPSLRLQAIFVTCGVPLEIVLRGFFVCGGKY